MIEVLQPGFATTVQDEGRPGRYRSGIAPSGAMDMRSHRLANALVGNEPGAASLEMTFMGPRLRFPAGGVVAVTGGDLPVLVNDAPAASWTTVHLAPGDEVSFAFLKAGTRAYLAVRGGVAVPEVMGSRSTHLLIGLGGLEGRALRAGDVLPVGPEPSGPAPATRTVPVERRPELSADVELRYVRGLFGYRLAPTGVAEFETRTWTVTPNADRTGIRVSSTGDALDFVDTPRPFGAGQDPSNVVDTGYPIGAIQIPSGTEPIVLSRDAVTAGGYFTVGAVISTDLDLLAQCPVRGRIRFRPVTVHEAIQARRDAAADLQDLIHTLTGQDDS